MDGNISNFRELIEILNKFNTEDEIVDFVKKRIDILEKNSQKRTIDRNNNNRLIGTINEGYISSDSPIISSYLVDPFYLDDITLYVEFLKHIKGKNLSNLLNIFYELRDFIEIAFGFKGNQQNREAVYLKPRNGKVSICDFYKNNSALCSERSAAVQNIVEFCCINSYLVFGKIEIDGKTEEHAYNIFKAKDGTLILFDSTNPVALSYGDKVGYAPAYSVIGKENINNVEEINFDFDYLSKVHNRPIYEGEKNRKYKTCNYVLNHENEPDKQI